MVGPISQDQFEAVFDFSRARLKADTQATKVAGQVPQLLTRCNPDLGFRHDLNGEVFAAYSGKLFVVASIDDALTGGSLSGGDFDLMSSSIESSDGKLDAIESIDDIVA